MSTTKFMQPQVATQIPEPPIARFLFADTRMAWFWLIVRLYVGYEWLTAGWEKLTGHSISFGSFGEASTGDPWVFSAHDGAAIKGFVAGAVAKTTGANPSVQGWYASFLQSFVLPHAALFAYVITFGKVLVGIALILGLLTGIAAFFGVFMKRIFADGDKTHFAVPAFEAKAHDLYRADISCFGIKINVRRFFML